MAHSRNDRTKEWARNIFLVILAVTVVVIFFNLDIMKKGESIFSQTADKKLKFKGDFARKDYTKREIERIITFAKRHNEMLESTTVDVSVQDKYRKVTGSSQVLFEVHLRLKNGATVSTPVRRTTRGNLVSDILTKLSKDMKAYKSMEKDGQKMKSLVNTM